MAKKRLHEESYQKAVEYARKFPSQITNMRELLSELEQELDRPDFEIRGTLYSLLFGATTQAKRDAVLRSYRQGLNEVDQEGRFEFRRVWQVPFGNEWISGAYLDGSRGQVVVTTSPGKSKKAGIYALRLENGKQRWIHRMKKNWKAWQPCFDQDLLFFATSYCGGGDFFSHSTLCAVSLKTGKLVWKWGVSREEELSDSVGAVCGLFKGLVIIRDEETGSLVAFDTATGEEQWRYPCSYFSGRGVLFLLLDDTLCLQYLDREIGWFLEDGTLVKKRTLRFPKRKKGFIDRVYAGDDDAIYLCLWGSWHVWDKRKPDALGKAKSQSVVYAVGKRDAEIRWLLRPKVKEWRCQMILPQDEVLYLCGENITLVVEKETGKVVREWCYPIRHVAGKLFFHADTIDTWDDEPFTFYVRDVRTGKVRWQRKSFELFGAEGGLLFGKVGSVLVVLDEKNGKERASIGLESEPREAVFVDCNSLLVIDAERKVLSLFELSGEA